MMYILSYPAYSLIYHIILHRLHVNELDRPVGVSLRVHCTVPILDPSTHPFAFS